MKNRWSPIAGFIGFAVALLAGAASDYPDTYITRIVCGGLMVLVQIMRLFKLNVSSWVSIFPLALIGALANAAWYMIVVEAVRLLLKKLSSR